MLTRYACPANKTRLLENIIQFVQNALQMVREYTSAWDVERKFRDPTGAAIIVGKKEKENL